jgi:hypothetical protein
MTPNPVDRLLESAQADVITAEEALAAAAETGEDTQPHRTRLVAAQDRLKAIETARQGSTAQAEADRQESMRQEADALVAQAQEQVREAIARYAELLVPEVPVLHSATALNLVAERLANEDRAAQVRAHDERVARLHSRLQELADRKRAIVTRRSEGEERESDAADIRLIELDTEVLTDLIGKLQSEAPSRQPETVWLKRWQAEADDAKRQAYGAMAAMLDDRLATLITEARRGYGRLTVSISSRLQSALAGVGVKV